MALSPEEVESAAPDAWTGKADAIVYETLAEVETWLTRRGHAVFGAADPASQESSLIRATELAEHVLKGLFRGAPHKATQGLLFPAFGAYDSQGYLIPENSAPRSYLEGIRLLANEASAGTLMPQLDVVGVKEEQSGYTRTQYRVGTPQYALSVNHPEAWFRIKTAIPRFI